MKRADMALLSFLIPVRVDSPGRLSNLDIVLRYLLRWFPQARILITECDSKPQVSPFISSQPGYQFHYSTDPIFFRTRINNALINRCETPIAGLYDTDIVLPPAQVEDSISVLLHQQISFAYPYDGRFVEVGETGKKIFSQCLSPSFLASLYPALLTTTHRSVGGCFMFSVDKYRLCGMENENIIGWGHDDAERVQRLRKLGEPLYRSPGPLYHLHHERGQNSFFYDRSMATRSYAEYFRICGLEPDTLTTEISTWQR